MTKKFEAWACDHPADSQLLSHLPKATYVDCFEVAGLTPRGSIIDDYAGVFGDPPDLLKTMMALRNALVKPFRIAGPAIRELETPVDARRSYEIGDRIGIWRLYGLADGEIIAGADDRHLDFRVALRRTGTGDESRVSLSTAVETLNALGRAYLAAILPFHRLFVRQLLTRAAAAGRI